MTISIVDLWMPILLGTALAWIASGLIHMGLKYHDSDYQALSNEDEVMDAVRKGSPGLGLHHFPHCPDMADMAKESMQAKFKAGPVGLLTIFPSGLPIMGKLLSQQIAFFLSACVLIAYCAGLVLDPGTEYMVVFRFVGTVAFMTFGWGVIPYSIWFGQLWPVTARYLLDAFIYASVIAAAFAWLWPGAV